MAYDLNPYLGRNLPSRVKPGTQQWLQVCIGHNVPFDVLNNETFQGKLESMNYALYKNDLQCNSLFIVGWLLNAHTKTFNYRAFTKLLQQHPLLDGRQVQCMEKVHRKHPNEPYKKKGDPGATVVAAIVTARNKSNRSKVKKACRRIFNTQTEEMAALRPQKTWMRRARPITVRGIVNFDYPFEWEDTQLTVQQILSTVKTRHNWRESIFNQVNTTWTGDTVGI